MMLKTSFYSPLEVCDRWIREYSHCGTNPNFVQIWCHPLLRALLYVHMLYVRQSSMSFISKSACWILYSLAFRYMPCVNWDSSTCVVYLFCLLNHIQLRVLSIFKIKPLSLNVSTARNIQVEIPRSVITDTLVLVVWHIPVCSLH